MACTCVHGEGFLCDWTDCLIFCFAARAINMSSFYGANYYFGARSSVNSALFFCFFSRFFLSSTLSPSSLDTPHTLTSTPITFATTTTLPTADIGQKKNTFLGHASAERFYDILLPVPFSLPCSPLLLGVGSSPRYTLPLPSPLLQTLHRSTITTTISGRFFPSTTTYFPTTRSS